MSICFGTIIQQCIRIAQSVNGSNDGGGKYYIIGKKNSYNKIMLKKKKLSWGKKALKIMLYIRSVQFSLSYLIIHES